MRLDKTKAFLVVSALALLVLVGLRAFQFHGFVKKEGGMHTLWASLREDFRRNRKAPGESARNRHWQFEPREEWYVFRDANFIGRVPKKVVKKKEEENPKPVQPQRHDPIDQVVELKFLYGNEDKGFALVQYKNPVQAPMETVPSAASSIHLLSVGDPLYTPHANWQLQRVLPAERAVLFRWENGEIKDEEKLGLGQIEQDRWVDDPAKLKPFRREGGGGSTAAGGGKARGSGKELRLAPIPKEAYTKDRPVRLEANKWFIPEAERARWRKNPDKLMAQVGLSPYSLPKGVSRRHEGQRSGLAISKLSPAMRQVGLEEGMILISLNGRPVTSKATLQRTARKLYDRGVRVFQARVLYYGREQTLTYRVDD